MLDDSGAQCHVPPITDMKDKMTTGVVKTVDGSTSAIFQIDNCDIEDKVGNEFKLQGIRVVEGIAHPITSLTQLMKEGWNVRSGEKKQHAFTRVDKNGSRLTFVEKKKNLFSL